MQRLRALALLAAIASVAVPALAEEPGPAVRITELLPNPEPSLGHREFIELHNAGSSAVDLTGWKVRDAPTASNNTNEYTFGAVTLRPGQRIVVWSNGSADAVGPSWSSSASKTVWNDAGDAATLLDASGAVRDWIGYGSTSQSAPPGFAADKPTAPTRGKSIQLDGAAWVAAAPTPGMALGQQGGPVSAQVTNVAPSVKLQVPASVRPGEAVVLRLNVSDGNGGDDVAAWSVSSGAALVRTGNGSFTGDLVATAPTQPGTWTLTAFATDAAGAGANATATATVRQPRLAVSLPNGGALRFPDLRPGDRNVTSLEAFTLRNDGEDPATPLVDVSAFRAGAAQIPVDGNLWVGVTAGEATTWVRYDGPLQPLPALAPGSTASLSLRIGAVPVPAPAGLYGTTFTVVAA
jgi:hypothetical protein